MALDAINRITIDVSDPLNTPVIKAVQEDIRSRYVEITLVSNGTALDIPAGAYGMIGLRRPNNTYVLYDVDEDGNSAITISGNKVSIYLSQESLAVAGSIYTSVSLYSSDGTVRLTAFHFIVDVEPTAVPSDVVVESDYFNILEGLVADAIDAANRAEQAAATVGNPVGYDPQTPSTAEQAQARQNIGIVSASTSAEGIVQLYNGVDSTSTTMAATAAAVKQAYDHIGHIIVSGASATFATQGTPTYADYPCRASVTIAGVTNDMFPNVAFGLSDAISGDYAPIADSYNGGVYLYGKTEGTITGINIVVFEEN